MMKTRESSARLVHHAGLWLRELRAYSLTASVMPVLLGVGLARAFALDFPLWMVLPVLGAGLLLHMGTNLINDAADVRKGVDRPGTTGGSGLLTSGELDPRTVFRVGVGMMVVAGVVGLPAVIVRGWPLVAMGAAGAVGGWAYTAGPAYKYRGLGDLGVFFLMGPLLVLAALFALTGSVEPDVYLRALLASLPMGMLVTAILAVNNYRDFEDDAAAGITTLAHLLGLRWAGRYAMSLLVLAFVATACLLVARLLPWTASMALLACFPTIGVLRDLVRPADERARGGPGLVERTAKVHALYGLLVFVALLAWGPWGA